MQKSINARAFVSRRGRAWAALVFAIAASVPLTSAHADSPATWTVSYPAGGTEDVASISKDKSTLSGTFAGSVGSTTCPGSLTGTQGRAGAVQFTVELEAPCAGSAQFTGRVEDDTSSAAGSSTWDAVRPNGTALRGTFSWVATIAS